VAEPTPDLQFDRAEFEGATPPAAACSLCQTPLVDAYYEVGGAVTCDACRRKIEIEWNQGSGLGRFVRAVVFGTLAAAAGCALYYGVLAVTGFEIGLIAIVVGAMVGSAVHAGSRGRGGWLYQGLAMFLTYSSIVMSFVPLILKQGFPPPGAEQGGPLFTIVALIFMIPLIYAVPFLAGIENIMGIIIIGIGVYVAWSKNKKTSLQVSGPYSLASRAPSPPPSAAA
jgi:hypothetical protein